MTRTTLGLVAAAVVIGGVALALLRHPRQPAVPMHSAQPAAPSAAPAPKPAAAPTSDAPPPVTSAALAALVDRRRADRIAPDFQDVLPRIDDPRDVAATVAVLRDRLDEDAVRHEAAELLRRSRRPELFDALAAILADPFELEPMRQYVMQYCFSLCEGRVDEGGRVLALLRAGLDDRHEGVRRESLWSLGRLGDAAALARASALLDDDGQSALHDIAIRLAVFTDHRDRIPRLRELAAASPLTIVRCAALQALAGWGDRGSLAIAQAAADLPATPANERLRRCGAAAAARLGAGDRAAP